MAYVRTVISEANDATYVNGTPMINYAKWTEFHTRVKHLRRHELPDVSKYHQKKAGMLAFVEDQFRDISIGQAMDEALKRRSDQLLEWEKQPCQEDNQEDRWRELGL